MGKARLRLALPGALTMPWLLLLACLAVFIAVYFTVFATVGVWASLLFVIPLAVMATSWGVWGGVLGGVISFPLNYALAAVAGGAAPAVEVEHALLAVVGVAVGAGMGGLRDANVRYRRLNAELEQANQRLSEALTQVKTLSGLIPICAGCGKMRDDRGTWLRIEEYLRGQPAVQFSHGLCPDCLRRLYPGAAEEEEAGGGV